MEVQKGIEALESKQFAEAISHFTNAIAQSPRAVDYYIKRSIAYTRVAPPQHESALKDAEIAVTLAEQRGRRELIAAAQLRRAVAFISLKSWADARKCLDWVKVLDPKEKSVPMWEAKVDAQLKILDAKGRESFIRENPSVELPTTLESVPATDSTTSTVSETTPRNEFRETSTVNKTTVEEAGIAQAKNNSLPPAAGTPPVKIRHEWYQNNNQVIVTIFAKGVVETSIQVDIQPKTLDISFPTPSLSSSTYHLSLDPLFDAIDPDKSSYKVMSTKVEITLCKSTVNTKWSCLESPLTALAAAIDEPANQQKSSVLHAPTSSKTGPKDWDKLANELSQAPKQAGQDGQGASIDIDDEEGDPVNNFFKTLYKDADADTRRAMVKSYQESNGTALSTNWSEVGKQKVEITPPDGMEAKTWG